MTKRLNERVRELKEMQGVRERPREEKESERRGESLRVRERQRDERASEERDER